MAFSPENQRKLEHLDRMLENFTRRSVIVGLAVLGLIGVVELRNQASDKLIREQNPIHSPHADNFADQYSQEQLVSMLANLKEQVSQLKIELDELIAAGYTEFIDHQTDDIYKLESKIHQIEEALKVQNPNEKIIPPKTLSSEETE